MKSNNFAKKIIAILLGLAMIIDVIPYQVFADTIELTNETKISNEVEPSEKDINDTNEIDEEKEEEDEINNEDEAGDDDLDDAQATDADLVFKSSNPERTFDIQEIDYWRSCRKFGFKYQSKWEGVAPYGPIFGHYVKNGKETRPLGDTEWGNDDWMTGYLMVDISSFGHLGTEGLPQDEYGLSTIGIVRVDDKYSRTDNFNTWSESIAEAFREYNGNIGFGKDGYSNSDVDQSTKLVIWDGYKRIPAYKWISKKEYVKSVEDVESDSITARQNFSNYIKKYLENGARLQGFITVADGLKHVYEPTGISYRRGKKQIVKIPQIKITALTYDVTLEHKNAPEGVELQNTVAVKVDDEFVLQNIEGYVAVVLDEEGEEVKFPIKIDRNRKFVVNWGQDHLVKFNTLGGSEVKNIYITHGTSLQDYWLKIQQESIDLYNKGIVDEIPMVPEWMTVTKKDSMFLGWYKDEEMKELFILSDYITSDITLYAKWLNSTEDTDSDGLPDIYEIKTLHTDSEKSDTDDNGVTDDKEDLDKDGLDNLKEYELGTNPLVADTDEDELKDGEEIGKYNTNPLKPDTDDDTILDGDEFLLGLNPNDVEDGKKTIEQRIDESDLDINKYNDDFKISIDVMASNNFKKFIKQSISEYTGFLSENNSIIGLPIDFDYKAGEIESGKVTIRLNDDLLNKRPHYFENLNLGIKRYVVFTYDSSVGTMVPLPCEYDESKNTIMVDTKYMSTLIVVDWESMMFDLGIDPYSIKKDETKQPLSTEDSTFSKPNSTNDVLEDYEDLSLSEIERIINSSIEKNDLRSAIVSDTSGDDSTPMRQVDLVLAIDTTGSMGSYIANVKINISKLISKLRKDRISLYVSLIDYKDITNDGKDSTKVNAGKGQDFYNSVSDVTSIISSMSASGGGDGPETPLDALGHANSLKYRSSSSKYLFLITDANFKNNNNFGITNLDDIAIKLANKGVNASVVTENYYFDTYSNLTTISGGELITLSGNFCDNMYDVIYAKTPKSVVVISNNIVSGHFKEPLVKDGFCDTDGDTLTDSNEIDWKNVKKINGDGTFELYTWKELCEKGWFKTEYTDGKSHPLFKYMDKVLVIPALSNPFAKDTDKDYYPDNKDENKIRKNPMYIFDEGINDTYFYMGTKIVEKASDKFTDGKFEIKTFNEGETENQASRVITGYSFLRKPNNKCEFTIKPKKTSYYKFKNTASTSQTVRVSYEKGIFPKERVYVEKETDGNYLLDQGTDYKIEVFGGGTGDYNFIVEQDNWVYAPNGGIWEPIKYSNCSIVCDLLITGEMHMPSHRIISSISTLTDGMVVVKVDPKGDVEKQLDIILKNTGMKVSNDDIKSAVLSLTSAGISLAGVIFIKKKLISPKITHRLISYIISGTGTTLTYKGAADALKTFDKYMEQYGFKRAYKEGKANVQIGKYIKLGLGNVWSPWKTVPYIYKHSINGDIGSVNTMITDKDIIDWCGWK